MSRSCAAVQAADLDWFVGSRYRLGRYILGCSQCLALGLWCSAQIRYLLKFKFHSLKKDNKRHTVTYRGPSKVPLRQKFYKRGPFNLLDV